MFQRLDRMRKHSFGSMIVFGENNSNSIGGLWMWRGHELAFTVSVFTLLHLVLINFRCGTLVLINSSDRLCVISAVIYKYYNKLFCLPVKK